MSLRNKIGRIHNFRGGLAAVLTPFDSNGCVNLQMINPYMRHLIANKVDGVFLTGTYGEGYSLTKDEKIDIMKKWKEEMNKNKPEMLCVVSITSTCINDMLEVAKECERNEIDAITFLPPIYYKLNTIREMCEYLKLIASAAPNTPLIYYYNPKRNGELPYELDDLIDEALKNVPQLAGVKFGDVNVAKLLALQNRCGDRTKIFPGSEEILATAILIADCNAAMCGCFTLPDVFKSFHMILDAKNNNDLETARKEQMKIAEVVTKHRRTNNFFLSFKTSVNKMFENTGINLGLPRAPVNFSMN